MQPKKEYQPEIFVKIQVSVGSPELGITRMARAHIREKKTKTGCYRYLQYRENEKVRTIYLGSIKTGAPR